MPHAIGTLEWMSESKGLLSPRESRALFMKVIYMQLTLIPDEWLHRLRLKKPRELSVDFESLTPPDTQGAQHARQLCRAYSNDFLFNHCERSYYWGRILGRQLGIEPDPELYYIACMLHDMGLTHEFGGKDDRPACFTQIGAKWCQSLGDDLGWSKEVIRTTSEAITLHLNPGVPLLYGAEAHLLNQATTLDTTALRLWRVPKGMTQHVLEAFPRLDQNKALPCCFHGDVERFPKTRTAWLEHWAQMSKRIARAKFAE